MDYNLIHLHWLKAINHASSAASERCWTPPAPGQADKQRSEQDAQGLMLLGNVNISLTFAGGPPWPEVRIADMPDCSSVFNTDRVIPE